MAMMTAPAVSLDQIARYRRATNYITAAEIYLQDNFLLHRPLTAADIKPRLLGHWGTAPGINLIYAHLNRLILDHDDAHVLLVTGPGHGAAANYANLWMEGTLGEYYPNMSQDAKGLGTLIHAFSWPRGFPSHLNPGTPAAINEGGELGYALATSFGAAFDNPDLIVACIVGDGEAETGPTATAWHGIKYLDPVTSGAVLPIVHINGYKIASATLYGRMSDTELTDLFEGYGWQPRIVEDNTPDDDAQLDGLMLDATEWAYTRIREIQARFRSGDRSELPRWPVILLRSLKGWTGPKEYAGEPIEGLWRAHQVPITDPKTNPVGLTALEMWLHSYKIEELFDADGHPAPDILACCPQGEQRMGKNPHAYGGDIRVPPSLPERWQDYAIDVPAPGLVKTSAVIAMSKYLRDVVANSKERRNFRIFCPDELESNRLGAVLDVTNRAWVWPTQPTDSHLAPDGMVVEQLSEHQCEGWLEGYLLTGRHGLFPCYEAFISIVDSMVNQFAKFLKQSKEVAWRKPVSSLNYLLTSEGWRQDHNGYSHQGPGFINQLLTKKASTVRIYLPPDANCLIQTMDHVLWSTNYINLVIASKQPEFQWLNAEQALEHCRRGASVWEWASTDGGGTPDIVMAAAGAAITNEMMVGVWLLKQEMPALKVRVVNVTDLMVLSLEAEHPHGLSDEEFAALFPDDVPVVFNFHGYPSALRTVLFERPDPHRFSINGYQEEGSTTTPLDMMIRNGTSRYHLVIDALSRANNVTEEQAAPIIREYWQKIADHGTYIEAHGDDPDEVKNWRWS